MRLTKEVGKMSKSRKLVELGDEVQDKVTGFKGIAVVQSIYLQGCDRFSVQPPLDKEGKMPESHGFDDAQLKILKKQKVKPASVQQERKPGGVDKYNSLTKTRGENNI